MEPYEDFVGSIDPEFCKPISARLQESLRELEQSRAVSKSWARFSILHASVTPTQISELLSLEPDDALVKGEAYYQKDGIELKARHNSWTLSSLARADCVRTARNTS